jgi:hypothetical protein
MMPLLRVKHCSFICAYLGLDVLGRIGSKREQAIILSLQSTRACTILRAVRGGGILPTDKIDFSTQFAIQNMMSTRQRARRFLKIVAFL